MKRDHLKSRFYWFGYLESQCRSQNNRFSATFQCLIFSGIVCWWDWNVSRRFVFVLVIVSPFCRNIPWVEVDLATWATEKKTISHFLLSFMHCFGVNLDCDTHTDHFSQVAANAFITKAEDGVSSMTIQWLQKNEHQTLWPYVKRMKRFLPTQPGFESHFHYIDISVVFQLCLRSKDSFLAAILCRI